ncbi:SpoIIE family protein phosphatase [Cellulomonas sp. URHD0024]|uniref:SpoIIE family protein phosphatase n=1 Tax=Cellulomonas sp. URHD0024 TaxID=1302620 RepID=UPI0003F4E0D4|nr:SpoIIE family protein phosphatase [Cellulomonas sp. URHD0024]
MDRDHAHDGLVARLLEAMPAAMFLVDDEWRFSYVNSAAEALLGATRAKLLGECLWRCYPAIVGTDFERHYRAAVATGEPVTFEAPGSLNGETAYEVRAWPGPDGLAVYFQDVTARRQAQLHDAREARRAALLAEVTSQLAEVLDIEQGLKRLARLLVPELADWCVVTSVDGHDTGRARLVHEVACAHTDPAVLPLVERYVKARGEPAVDNPHVKRALQSGEVMAVPAGSAASMGANLPPGEARDLLAQLAPDSGLMFGLRGRGRTTGLVTMFNSAGRGGISPEDLTLAQEISTRAGLALDNIRLYHQQRRVAEGLQLSLLSAPAHPDHVQVAVRYVPAAEAAHVGGDWYDAFMQADGHAVLVIGDVVGHDLRATAAMGQLRSKLRAVAVATGAAPGDLLTRVDQTLRTLNSRAIATVVVAQIEPPAAGPSTGPATIRWSNAGHPPPMLLTPDGAVTRIENARADLLLGVHPDTDRQQSTLELSQGATLLLYTDGLVESRTQSLQPGLDRLSATLGPLAGLELETLCDQLLAEMLPPYPQDDVAILAIRLRPTADGSGHHPLEPSPTPWSEG